MSTRTTVALPDEVYQVLRTQSFLRDASFGEVISDWYYQSQTKTSKETTLADDLKLFKQIAKTGKKIDLVKTLREDRDR